jgi:hypothetical protein
LEAETEEAAAVVKVAAMVKTAAIMEEMVKVDVTDGKCGSSGRDGGGGIAEGTLVRK